MKKAFAALLILMSSASLRAETAALPTDNAFCKTTEGIDQIKSFLACQSKPGLAACVGLGAAVGGRVMAHGIEEAYKKMMESNREPLIRDLAETLHDEWRAPRKLEDAEKTLKEKVSGLGKLQGMEFAERKAEVDSLREAIARVKAKGGHVYNPRIKFVDGKAVDIANTIYDALPEKFKFDNRESARTAIQDIYAHIKAGGKIDDPGLLDKVSDSVHKRWVEINGSWAPEHQKVPFAQLSKEEADKDRVIVRKAMKAYFNRTTSVGGKSFQAVLRASRALGKKSLLAMGGLVGAGFWALDQVVDSTPTACAGSYYTPKKGTENSIGVMNQDPAANCQPVYEVDANVVSFLSKPIPEQENLMRNPQVCDYYQKLHEKLMKQPKFTKLECGSTSFSLETTNDKGEKVSHKVLYASGSRQIRQINTQNVTPSKFQWATSVFVDGEGNIQGAEDSEIIARTAVPLKMYISDAYNCCNANSDQEGAKCRAAYNGGKTAPAGAPGSGSPTIAK